MKELDFTLALIDGVTRPLKQIEGSMKSFTKGVRQSFANVAAGAGVMWGVAQAAEGAMSPALDMYTELQKASAMGVSDNALKQVKQDALNFSMAYGKSATEFVQSSAAINSAISGLTDKDLPKVTMAANTMAAAVGVSAEETSEFMRQMFGQFSQDADQLGKAKFAEELAGKMTYMRQVFGTNVADMQDMIQGAHGAGNAQGVGLDEQFAVLGQLHRTLGSEASGTYEAFMSSAADGMGKLGLAATDSHGKLLPMVQLLQEIQGKYGKNIAGNAKAQAELDAAFGSGSIAVKQLYGNTELLERSMRELGGSDSMRRAKDAAAQQAKVMDRLNATFTAIRTTIGMTLMPAFNKVAGVVEHGSKTFERWMQLFPNIARVIGVVAAAIITLSGVTAAFTITWGVLTLAIKPFTIAASAAKGVLRLLAGAEKEATFWQILQALWTRISTGLMKVWAAVTRVMTGVMWLLNVALEAGAAAMTALDWPILLVVGAIALLTFGVYELCKHWDGLMDALASTKAWQAVAAGAKWVGDALKNVYSMAKNLFSGLWDWLKSCFSDSWNWIVSKLNQIPGVNISTSQEAAPPVATNTLSTGGVVQGIASGGISNQISNQKSAVDNSKRIGQVNVYPQGTYTPAQLMEWQELAPQ